jgi:hypothetical protein
MPISHKRWLDCCLASKRPRLERDLRLVLQDVSHGISHSRSNATDRTWIL